MRGALRCSASLVPGRCGDRDMLVFTSHTDMGLIHPLTRRKHPSHVKLKKWASPWLSRFFKLQKATNSLILRGMPSGQSLFPFPLNSKATHTNLHLSLYFKNVSVFALHTVVLFLFFFPHTPVQISLVHTHTKQQQRLI